MTLPEILKAVRQWWWILVICPVIAAVTAFLISSSMTPIYEAETTAWVEHQGGGMSDLQSIQAAERRTQTFAQLVSSRSVLSRVVETLNLSESVSQLRSDVSVSHARETQLINISVRNPDPDQAALIANTIADEFAGYVSEIQEPVLGEAGETLSETLGRIGGQIQATQTRINMLESSDDALSEAEQQELSGQRMLLEELQEVQAALSSIDEAVTQNDTVSGSQIFVVEAAAPSSSAVSPRTLVNTALAGILGLLVGSGLVVGVAWLDDNVKTEQDIRRLVERPVIGTVPQENLPEHMENIHSGRSISGEIFRGLRTNLQFTMFDRNIKSLVVTSVVPGEGKTTVAANLAIVLAQGGQRVILVDSDMRRPRIHNMFSRVRNDRGLSNLLLQSPAVIEDVLQDTAINNLKVLATGPLPPNPPDLIGSARMRALVTALEESADFVIFDSPPVAISESLLLSSLADGILLVVRASKLRTAELVDGAEDLAQTGVPILGVVLNGVKPNSQAAHRVYQQYYPLVTGEEELPQPKPKGRLTWLTRVFDRSA